MVYEKKGKALYLLAFIMILPVLALSGCFDEEGNDDNSEEEGEYTYIRIGTINNDVDKMFKRYQSTADYIAEKLSTDDTKFKGKVVLGRDQTEMIQLLKEGEIDLYFDSPLVGYLVAEQAGSDAFLRRWKQEVAEYHTIFVVHSNSTIGSIQELEGKRIGFESPDSTSGYLLPKAYMLLNGLELSEQSHSDKVQYQFTNEDENSALWVTEGRVECAAFSNMDLEETPPAIAQKLKVINRTRDIPRHIVFTSPVMDPDTVQDIKDILIDMDKDQEGIIIMEEFKHTKKYDEIPDEGILREDMIQMLSTLGMTP